MSGVGHSNNPVFDDGDHLAETDELVRRLLSPAHEKDMRSPEGVRHFMKLCTDWMARRIPGAPGRELRACLILFLPWPPELQLKVVWCKGNPNDPKNYTVEAEFSETLHAILVNPLLKNKRPEDLDPKHFVAALQTIRRNVLEWIGGMRDAVAADRLLDEQGRRVQMESLPLCFLPEAVEKDREEMEQKYQQEELPGDLSAIEQVFQDASKLLEN